MPDHNKPSFSLVDLKGVSAPLTKLIDTISKAVGVVYEPNRIRRKAKAEADALIVTKIGEVASSELAERARKRINTAEFRRQLNIEAIIAQTASSLPESVGTDPVEEDWVYKFVDHCKDVSSKEMHEVWGKVLAKEVTKPGSVSYRTLSVLGYLNKRDARIFQNFCSFTWEKEGYYYHFKDPNTYDILSDSGLAQTDIVRLTSLGLIDVGNLGLHFFVVPGIDNHVSYFDDEYRLLVPGESNREFFSVFMLSTVGQELYSIACPFPNERYRDYIIGIWEERGICVESKNKKRTRRRS